MEFDISFITFTRNTYNTIKVEIKQVVPSKKKKQIKKKFKNVSKL